MGQPPPSPAPPSAPPWDANSSSVASNATNDTSLERAVSASGGGLLTALLVLFVVGTPSPRIAQMGTAGRVAGIALSGGARHHDPLAAYTCQVRSEEGGTSSLSSAGGSRPNSSSFGQI